MYQDDLHKYANANEVAFELRLYQLLR